jgi:hypothetical protein
MTPYSAPSAKDCILPETQAERPVGVRSRLTVLGEGELDTVQAAGGLVYEKAVMGWEVEVFVSVCTSQRPFRILGVRAEGLDRVFALHVRPYADVVVANLGLYENNELVHRYIRGAARHGAEIALWGDSRRSDGSRRGAARVEYQLGKAAQAFKQQAVYAAGAKTAIRRAEIFHGGHFRTPTLLLSPAPRPVKARRSARIEYRSRQVDLVKTLGPRTRPPA